MSINLRRSTEKIDIPWSDDVPDSASDSEEHKQTGSTDVGPAEERILATDPRDRGNDDRLGAPETFDGIVYFRTVSMGVFFCSLVSTYS